MDEAHTLPPLDAPGFEHGPACCEVAVQGTATLCPFPLGRRGSLPVYDDEGSDSGYVVPEVVPREQPVVPFVLGSDHSAWRYPPKRACQEVGVAGCLGSCLLRFARRESSRAMKAFKRKK